MMYLLKNMRFSLLLMMMLVLPLSACQTMTGNLSAKQIALLQQQGFKQVEEGWELSFAEKLLFGVGAYELTEKSQEAVLKISKALLSVGIENLRVEGHTDIYGTDAYNQKLSSQRADSVADILSQAGIKRTGITVVGVGKNRPIADNSTAAGRAENRRVSIIVLAR